MVGMINQSRRNASLSDLNINLCVTFQEPLLVGNKNDENLLTQCSLLLKGCYYRAFPSCRPQYNEHIQALKVQVIENRVRILPETL